MICKCRWMCGIDILQFLLSYVVETSLGDPDTAIIASPIVLPVMSLLFTILAILGYRFTTRSPGGAISFCPHNCINNSQNTPSIFLRCILVPFDQALSAVA